METNGLKSEKVIFRSQGVQDSVITETPGIVMRFFLSGRGYLRNQEMPWDCFTKASQFFKLVILISYLLDTSPRQDINFSGKSLTETQAFSSYTPIERGMRLK